MPGSIVFRTVPQGDYQRRSRTAYPSFTAVHTDATSSGYTVEVGVFEYHPAAISSSQYYQNTITGNYASNVWRLVNQLYYSNPYSIGGTLEHYSKSNTYKHLHYSCSVISIPQLKFGDAIKGNSLRLSISNNLYTATLQDDSHGNLVDTAINSGSFAPSNNLLWYVTVNDWYRHIKEVKGVPQGTYFSYNSNVYQPQSPLYASNIRVTTGLTSSGTVNVNQGLEAHFSTTSSYIRIPNSDNIKMSNNKNWALSFWLNSPGYVTASDNNYIISKLGTETVTELDTTSGTIIQVQKNITRTRYPYAISMISGGYLVFQKSDGTNNLIMTSSRIVGDGTYRHILLQKTGSTIELYLDAALDTSSIDRTNNQTYNNSDIMFGALNTAMSGAFSGSLGEVRFYNTALSGSHIASLANRHWQSGSLYQTATVGNVYYRSGIVVISSPYAKYSEYNALKDSWTLTYNGMQSIYEHEILVRVPKDTYNFTVNPSILKEAESDLVKDEITTGSLSPYITTIGLYNDNAECLAIGKLAQPIQKRDDVDLNFIVRFDT